MRIDCLHTADSNISIYDDAAGHLGFAPDALMHAVRPDLLAAAEQAGGVTAAIESDTVAALLALGAHADAVILTCSTLGPIAALAGANSNVPVFRADQSLAQAAVRQGGRISVLCAVETTLKPTGDVFAETARLTGAHINIRLVDGAWSLFKAGDLAAYHRMIARAADDAYADGATKVVLAQSSMAGAAPLVTRGPTPLTSPAAVLADARTAILHPKN